jgi:methyl-accepting chemotaxis protein
MKEKVIFKRRKYFLRDSFQPKLIFKTYLILLSVMFVSGGIFYFVGNKNLTEEFFQAHSVIKTTMQLLLPALILVNLIGLLGASVLVIGFTHSIAGPIYRLKYIAEKIATGDLTLKVQFRKRDTVGDLAEIINTIIRGLNKRMKEFSTSLEKLSELSQEIDNIDRLSYDELLKFKKELLATSSQLLNKIERFKL